MSKNAISINQLMLACEHAKAMRGAGVTENLSIRTLELFADVYAKLHSGGSASPHHVRQVELWSVKARKLLETDPDLKPRDCLRVEHGTPRRALARKILELHMEGKLNRNTMNKLVARYWKLAVITIDEDLRLNKVARSRMFDTPEERWAEAGIKF